MLNGELNSSDRLNGELTGGVFYGTNDYEELINKPSINSIELEGNKSLTDLGIDIPNATSQLTNDSGFITSADVPTATSQLTNDSGFITSADVPTATSQLINDSGFITSSDIPAIPTKTSELTNDSGFITSSAVPSRTSQLVNDSGFITSADVPTKTSELDNDSGFITSADIPTDVSAFTNDAGYITSSDIPTDVSAFTNDAGYISNSDLMTATASGSIATFDNGGDDIPVSEFECEIVAQQGSGTPSPSDPLPITGFSQADITVCGDNFFPSLDTETKSGFTVTNNNGVLTLSGTAGANTTFTKTFTLAKGSYNICALNGTADSSYRMELMNGATQIANAYLNSANRNVNFTLENTAELTFNFYVPYGKVGGNYTLSPQITLGSGAELTFKPYTGNLYTVAFGQTIYGGRLIYANGQWSIEATHGFNVYDGSEDWVYQASNTFRLGIPTGAKPATTPKNCNMFAPSLSGADNTIFFGSSNMVITSAYFNGDVNAFKTFLSNNNLQICYELATPVIIPITSSTRVKTISGDNNIYSSTGDCEVKYFTNKADSLAELVKAFVV